MRALKWLSLCSFLIVVAIFVHAFVFFLVISERQMNFESYFAQSPQQVWNSFSPKQKQTIDSAYKAGATQQAHNAMHNAYFKNMLTDLGTHIKKLEHQRDWFLLHLLSNGIACGFLGLLLGFFLLQGRVLYLLSFALLFFYSYGELFSLGSYLYISVPVTCLFILCVQTISLLGMNRIGFLLRRYVLWMVGPNV